MENKQIVGTIPALPGTSAKGYITLGEYANFPWHISLVIWEDDPEELMALYCAASVNLGGADQPPGTVWIKNWSENEGIVELLKQADVIEGEPILYRPSGFVHIPLYKLSQRVLSIQYVAEIIDRKLKEAEYDQAN